MKKEFGAHRVGVIPFDTRGEDVAMLFVTSQTRGRWILPKGKRFEDESHLIACQREGFEEAGVRGTVIEDFPMTAVITKQAKDRKRRVPVTYYPLLVTEQSDDWPEKEKRQRHWALARDARRVAYREDILDVINQFEALTPWIIEVANLRKGTPPK